jgi:hypothetical protein
MQFPALTAEEKDAKRKAAEAAAEATKKAHQNGTAQLLRFDLSADPLTF